MKNNKSEEVMLKNIKNGSINKRCSVLLFMGIVLLVISAFFFGWGFKRISNVGDLSIKAIEKHLNEIDAKTELEIKLKKLILDQTLQLEHANMKYVRENSLRMGSLCLLTGAFFIVVSFILRKYSNLIKSIKQSNQADSQRR